MIKVIYINADKQTVESLDMRPNDLPGFQSLVGGYLETVASTGLRDTLLVNEDGHRLGFKRMFSLGITPILRGNGVLVGPLDSRDEFTDASLDIELVKRAVAFFGTDEETRATLDG